MTENTSAAASDKTVTVGCKLPHGLILELKNNDGDPVRYTLKGANSSRIVGGHGLTEGIDAEFMSQWFKRHARHPAVVNNMIFLHSNPKAAASIAKERRDLVTGFEAIDPLKKGMMEDEKGEVDKGALKKYEQQKAENPDRNRQQVLG